MNETAATEFESFACDIARGAGEVLRKAFRPSSGHKVERKGTHDFVTEVDRAAEDVLVSRIRGTWPDHAVMAEEGSPEAIRTGYRWILDPLDGTTNFIQGVPTFAVSVALEDQDGLVAGAVYDPVHDEMFHAARGAGAKIDGAPMRVSAKADLNDTLLATGFPFRDFSRIEGYLGTLREFMRTTSGIRRAGAAAIDLAYTACGRYDGFFEVGLAPWDLAAGALLILEAGGSVTDCGGGPDWLLDGEIVAGPPSIHAEMLQVTRVHLAGR